MWIVRLVLAAWLLAAGAAHADIQDFPVSGGGPYSVRIGSMKEARFRATLRQQFDFSCGSAAVATLLTHHYGLPTSEQAAFEAMFRQGDQAKIRQEGFSLLDMKRYLQGRGFQADGFEASLDELAKAGVPAIALISENGYHHFVVIKGLRGNRLLIGDPATGRRTVARADFEKQWETRVLFLIHDTSHRPIFNATAEWNSAPAAPLADGLDRGSLASTMLGRRGPGDY